MAALRLTISRQEETHPQKAHPPKKNALFEPVVLWAVTLKLANYFARMYIYIYISLSLLPTRCTLCFSFQRPLCESQSSEVLGATGLIGPHNTPTHYSVTIQPLCFKSYTLIMAQACKLGSFRLVLGSPSVGVCALPQQSFNHVCSPTQCSIVHRSPPGIIHVEDGSEAVLV